MTRTHRGQCHCGRIVFEWEADVDIDTVVDCNCSLCRRRGALWHPVVDEALRLLQGEAERVEYRFGTGTAAHYFCRHCGIHPFARPRLDPTMWVVNVRCVDGVDLAALRVLPFDGEHWEEAAAAFVATRRALRPDG